MNPVFNVTSSGNGGDGNNTDGQTLSTGAIFRNIGTDLVVVTLLNVNDTPQTVTVSVRDWSFCTEEEIGKFAYLCGLLITDTAPLTTEVVQPQQTIIVPPDIPPILTPFSFTIPARSLLTIHAYPPQPFHPPNPCYEVRVTYPPSPLHPPSPLIVNTWGLNASGVIQEGNRVLHHQLIRIAPPSPI